MTINKQGKNYFTQSVVFQMLLQRKRIDFISTNLETLNDAVKKGQSPERKWICVRTGDIYVSWEKVGLIWK